METNDRRSDQQKAQTRYFVNVTDKAMSGWGKAPDRSFYCIACPDMETAQEVESRCDQREEFKRVAIADKPRRGGAGCHQSITWHESFTWRPS